VFNELDGDFDTNLDSKETIRTFSELDAVRYIDLLGVNFKGGLWSKVTPEWFDHWYPVACNARTECDTKKSAGCDRWFAPWCMLVQSFSTYEFSDRDILSMLVYRPDAHCRIALDPTYGTGVGLQVLRDLGKDKKIETLATPEMVKPSDREFLGYSIHLSQAEHFVPDVIFTAERILAKTFPLGRYTNALNFGGHALRMPQDPRAVKSRRCVINGRIAVATTQRTATIRTTKTAGVRAGEFIYVAYRAYNLTFEPS
jgi:hypothetical protein